MNKKLVFLSLIVAIAAVSVGTLSMTAQESEVQPQMVQKISSTALDVSLEQLIERAEYAIVGKVVKVTPVIYVDPDRAQKKAEIENLQFAVGGITPVVMEQEILSDVKIKVREDLFGKYTENFITVRVPGGEIPTLKTIHERSPTFDKDERIVVFVGKGQSYDIPGHHYTVVGLDQGTIKLGEKIKSQFATTDSSEDSIKNKIKSLKNKD